MSDDRDDSWRLQFIKSHVDYHGIGCAIIKDHVVIALADNVAEGDRDCAKIKRVKSFDEACQVIGCRCRELDE